MVGRLQQHRAADRQGLGAGGRAAAGWRGEGVGSSGKHVLDSVHRGVGVAAAAKVHLGDPVVGRDGRPLPGEVERLPDAQQRQRAVALHLHLGQRVAQGAQAACCRFGRHGSRGEPGAVDGLQVHRAAKRPHHGRVLGHHAAGLIVALGIGPCDLHRGLQVHPGDAADLHLGHLVRRERQRARQVTLADQLDADEPGGRVVVDHAIQVAQEALYHAVQVARAAQGHRDPEALVVGHQRRRLPLRGVDLVGGHRCAPDRVGQDIVERADHIAVTVAADHMLAVRHPQAIGAPLDQQAHGLQAAAGADIAVMQHGVAHTPVGRERRVDQGGHLHIRVLRRGALVDADVADDTTLFVLAAEQVRGVDRHIPVVRRLGPGGPLNHVVLEADFTHGIDRTHANAELGGEAVFVTRRHPGLADGLVVQPAIPTDRLAARQDRAEYHGNCGTLVNVWRVGFT